MKLLTIICTILLVSCGSLKTSTAQDASDNISKETFKSDSHANAIEESNPELKPHTEAIKASNESIRSENDVLASIIIELEEDLEEAGGFFKSIVSLMPIIIGILSIVLGRLTNDRSDTICGAIMFIAGIAVYSYWSSIGVIGLVIMVGLAISWVVISQEEKAKKKHKEEVYK